MLFILKIPEQSNNSEKIFMLMFLLCVIINAMVSSPAAHTHFVWSSSRDLFHIQCYGISLTHAPHDSINSTTQLTSRCLYYIHRIYYRFAGRIFSFTEMLLCHEPIWFWDAFSVFRMLCSSFWLRTSFSFWQKYGSLG